MTDRIDSLERVAASVDAAPRVVLTVRLYGHAHELLVEEFASVGRRRRAARATQLMLVGLLCERANLRTGLAIPAIPPPSLPHATNHTNYGLPPEADAFLSAILRSAGSPETGDERTPQRTHRFSNTKTYVKDV